MIEVKKNMICCVVVTFNPDAVLLRLIESIENQVDKIIVVDNCSESSNLTALKSLSNNNVLLIYNEANFGIAKALNQGVIQAKEMGYDWVITFDQDSKPFSNLVEILCNVYALYPNKQAIGAIGINMLKANGATYYRASNADAYIEKDYLITSGCLLSVEAFTLIGGFREDLFIDNVDLEYSLRLKKFGRKLLISGECGMHHDPGNPKSRTAFGIKFISSNHNGFRRYYMARNHLILSKKYYYREPYFIAKMTYFFLLSFFQMVVVDDDKASKVLSSIKGVIDGVFYSSSREKYST